MIANKHSFVHLFPLGFTALTVFSLAACLKGTVGLGSDTTTSGSGLGGGSGSGSGMTEQCGEGGSGFGGSGHGTLTYTDPPGIDTGKAIADLTPTESTAWCTWYLGVWTSAGWSNPSPHDAMPMGSGTNNGPFLGDGYVWGGEGLSTDGSDGMCMMRVSVHDCVENLTATSCGATVQALDDCVQAFLHQCPSTMSRCNAYRAECQETIVVTPTSGSPMDCRLPIE